MNGLRIAWVKIGGLWPLHTGGRLRSFHIVSELSRRHRVTVLTTHRPGEDPSALARRLPHCERVVSFPHAAPKQGSWRFVGSLARSWLSPLPVDLWKSRVPAVRAEVERLVGAGLVDLCVADFLVAAPNVPLGGAVPVVLFEHNVEHMIWKRLAAVEARAWRRRLLALEWRKMRRCEARACAQATLTIAVSDVDRALLATDAPGARVATVPTGVDTAYFAPNGVPESPAHLVFIGSMDWYPNEDAMVFFVGEVLPLIRRAVPDARLTVVGRNPSARLRALGEAAGVRITGTVEDVRAWIAEAAVYVVPLRVGGGTRLKIFEGLAMGKAVVSTTVGAEGLPLVDGTHFVRADGAAEFARAVVSLVRDPDRRRTLGTAGRRLVEARYSWAEVAREFEARCEPALVARAAAAASPRVVPGAVECLPSVLASMMAGRRHNGGDGR
jgi:glycosyltransferase involved in cell wall biosynthesis